MWRAVLPDRRAVHLLHHPSRAAGHRQWPRPSRPIRWERFFSLQYVLLAICGSHCRLHRHLRLRRAVLPREPLPGGLARSLPPKRSQVRFGFGLEALRQNRASGAREPGKGVTESLPPQTSCTHSVFFSLLYVSSVNFLVIVLDCRDRDGVTTLREFPAHECWQVRWEPSTGGGRSKRGNRAVAHLLTNSFPTGHSPYHATRRHPPSSRFCGARPPTRACQCGTGAPGALRSSVLTAASRVGHSLPSHRDGPGANHPRPAQHRRQYSPHADLYHEDRHVAGSHLPSWIRDTLGEAVASLYSGGPIIPPPLLPLYADCDPHPRLGRRCVPNGDRPAAGNELGEPRGELARSWL